tara:strand:+ start:2144 stop:2749 length:606 start_codon:yes stop_codon:yes gene_type:complete
MSIRNELLEQIYQATLSGGSTPYYVEATRFTDLTTQTGGAIDTLAGVKLGAGGTDPEGLVSADVNGVITINKTGPYMVKQSFQITRNTTPGNAEIFFQAQSSADNGVTWTALGNAINRRISNDNTINVFFDFSPVFLPAGIKVRNVWAKSSVGGDPADPSVGVDNGLLIYTAPSAALTTLGVMNVPSAIAVVYKLQGYNYV